MRKLSGIVATMATLAIGGCQFVQQPKPQVSSSRAVLDVPAGRPTPPRFAAPVQVAPPEDPPVAIAVEPSVSVTPDFRAPKALARKTPDKHVQPVSDKPTYKVKKGDTLYRIAKTEYGDGKKWTVIASANPGLSPQSLKSGQTIVIP